jgi:bifunctional enzyme CysN/CysC
VIAAFISPYAAERAAVREKFVPGEYFEVFVDTPLQVASERDPKGLYARARSGALTGFTGVDAPYEAPERPELRIATTDTSPEAAADAVIALLERDGILTR